MATSRRPEKPSAILENPIPSSSPAFGTPVHPIPPRRTAPIRAPPALKPAPKPTILPILLPPATLRPLAFRTFTKKHNLTLTSSALQSLAAFIGRHCGSGWREEGLAEKVLEEVAKSWKKCGSQVIVEGDGDTLKGILKALEGSMMGGRITPGSGPNSRQASFNFGADASMQDVSVGGSRPGLESHTSFGMSSLEVEDRDEEEDLLRDPREWLKVIDAFDQPKMVYNISQKHFEKSASKPSLFPDPSHKTELFRQRYHVVHQRILRNETFQTPTFSAARSAKLNRTASAATQATTITPIANLLGRSGTTHLLLGMLTVSPTAALSLSDLTGTIALDLQHARPIPEDGSYFAPGMIVLVEGSYEEDYGNHAAGSASALGGTGGIGGTIGGKFIGFSVGHPPCERRTTSLGTGSDGADKSLTPAFGWTDFLGVGSERATGTRMSRLASKLLPPTSAHNVVIASDLHLDTPSTLSALKTLLRTYSPDPTDLHPVYPLAIILMGNFSSRATLTGVPGAGSIEYKEHFDALASVLADFSQLIAHTTLIFVPGDNDAWPSAFSAGAASPLPRKPVPALFTNRIRRAVAEANREVWGTGKTKGKEGEVIWTSNPSRLSWFGVHGELAILRDDMLGRLHRTSIRFGQSEQDGEDMPDTSAIPQAGESQDAMDIDLRLPDVNTIRTASSLTIDPDLHTARALTRTLLSQSHLSPFPLSVRPLHWDFAHSMNLYPLPTALLLADSEAPPFVVKYCGCTVMNPGSIEEKIGSGKREGRARWVEWDVGKGVGVVRTEG
ncbi:DNA polymeras-like protein epsilon subunit B [Amniculicola lignicola CBS 123094]|uniref:DNA polymerase epsilon subunit B n=1 Tax=Amniculicola lignicola CBS 123094 TaxID=1392246 RepID=A0A6A5WSP9_9PLEO|nr:DNA polymeras-like protein epsilon subunit B [Amniculicola lignicola CBS 123094]